MGTLYIVPTPIGNLKDITLRALEVLQAADLIVAEDTRHSGVLMQHYQISRPLDSFHSHSDQRKLTKLLNLLQDGKTIALISDAGTPGISDPGYLLIKSALEQGSNVIPLPGASAFLTALSASGLPTDKFLYLGFLPVKKGRQTLFKTFAETEQTIVFYESPHRLLKTLSQLNELYPERPLVVARELTKLHEEFFRGTVNSALKHFETNGVKGEFVLLLGAK